VGDTQTIHVDARVIAASNRNLKAEIESGRFREDLYWRLNVIPIHIPPLRDRREDILPLVSHFLKFYSDKNDCYVTHIAPDALAALQAYDWPGNVRELQNYIERSVVLAEDDSLTLNLLPEEILRPTPRLTSANGELDIDGLTRAVVSRGLAEASPRDEDLHHQIVNRVERELLSQVLAACNNTQTKAALRLGINRNTLHKKIRDYGLE
jgi:DNA-binding NtrC family response regulator